MFETLTESLGSFFSKIGAKGRKITETDVKEGLRTVRMALLEADVALPVVKTFMDKVGEKAVGQAVLESVQPQEQLVKIVHDELIDLMGGGEAQLVLQNQGPTIIMMCGLQGSGKTTTTAKLANRLKAKGRKPLLVAADLQRPAAVAQLKVLGEDLDVPVFSESGVSPPDVCVHAVAHAKQTGRDIVLLDTAGRLHIDDDLMKELETVQQRTQPHEILLVVDAMVGQDAVQSAKEFDARLPISGVILTKLDGDARGGAALSVKHVTGKPIKFVGVGEKLDRLEEFHPERMATRILGMGDVVSLVEKAQQVIDQDQAQKFQDKMLKDRLTLEDFLTQLRAVKKMGSIKDLLGMVPGMAGLKDLDASDDHIGQVEAVICSMTPEERRNPSIIGASRKQRIARGSGVSVNDVSRLLKQFEDVTKQLSSLGKAQKFVDRMMPGPAGAQRPGRVLTAEQRKEIKKRRKLEKERKKKNRR
ncbi:MAG: signal recognition particle protein [Planctomycetes bacterium]|nr:signal recognition particle protein [Planctomycetota bacterium]